MVDFDKKGKGKLMDYLPQQNAQRIAQIASATAGGGEINTMSSQGTGTSIYYQKSGVDLQLNAIKSENDRITISLDGATHDIEVTLNEGNILHNSLGGLNAGDNYEHITQAQKNVLHAIYTLEVHNNDFHNPDHLIDPILLVEMGEQGAPAANKVVIWAEDENGHTVLKYKEADGHMIVISQDNYLVGRNTSGAEIAKGKVVYFNGTTTGKHPNFSLAKADSLTTMPAIGITVSTVAHNAYTIVLIRGRLTGLNTPWANGTILYVSSTVVGGYTNTFPPSPSIDQQIGTVEVNHAVTGVMLVDFRQMQGRNDGTIRQSFSIGDGASGDVTLAFNGDAGNDGSIIWDVSEDDFVFNYDIVVPNLITAGLVDGIDVSAIRSFKTITGITNNVVADNVADTLTLVAGAGLTIVGTAATDTITFTNTITQYTNALAVQAVEDAGLVLSATKVITSQDADLEFIFGRGRIWSPNADFAAFGHRDQAVPAIDISAAGATRVLALGGQTLSLLIGAVPQVVLNGTNVTLSVPLAMGAHDITLGAGQLVDGKDVSTLGTDAEAHAYVEANALTMTQDITFNAGQLFDGEDVSALAVDLANQCTTAEAIAAVEAAGLTMAANIVMGTDDITFEDGGLVDGQDVSAMAQTLAGKCTTGEAIVAVQNTGLMMAAGINMNNQNLTTGTGTVDGVDVSVLKTNFDALDYYTQAEVNAALHTRLHAITDVLDHSASNWKLFYSDGAGHVIELALGIDGQILTSTGAETAPAFEAAEGGASVQLPAFPTGTIAMTLDNAWHDVDISTTYGAKKHLVFLHLFVNCVNNSAVIFFNDNTANTIVWYRHQVANVQGRPFLQVQTDSNGIWSYKGTAITAAQYCILGVISA